MLGIPSHYELWKACVKDKFRRTMFWLFSAYYREQDEVGKEKLLYDTRIKER